MPTVNVTERRVSPRLDYGFVTGLIAGAVVSVWMFLVGALGDGTAADHGSLVAATVLGDAAFEDIGFNGDWLIGQIVHFATFGLIGIFFALAWPKLRTYGVWSPSLLFAVATYVIVVQVIFRLVVPELPGELGVSGLLIGYLLAGFVFSYRYRRA